ncbi:MAG: hypothetical protein JOZ52_08165, partial [Acidobacteria bacterium]|nr:hypothetical protein [Acidobacteriota bacterium]
MAKASTKSRGKASRIVESEAAEVSDRVWRLASVAILAVATLLRVYYLTLKP